jgi:peptidoglycan L-alanyl-D-glutamate endopeptidase CwlK
MYQFSKRSKEELATCHDDLQSLFQMVIRDRDCSILKGRRGAIEQEMCFENGTSNAHYGQSPHNTEPKSCGVDVMPYPVNWDDVDGVMEFRNFVELTAKLMGIELHPLIKFLNRKGQLIIDWPHYQLASWQKPKET